MADIADLIRTELFYTHDLDRIRAIKRPECTAIGAALKHDMTVYGLRLLGGVKASVRGAVVGAVAGAAVGLLLGEEGRGLWAAGAYVGVPLDLCVYMLRSSPLVMSKLSSYRPQQS